MSLGKKIFGLGFLILAVTAPGCENWNEDEQVWEQMTDKQKQQRLMLRIDRNYADADAQSMLGDLYLKKGKFEDAIYQYKVALSYDPVHFSAQTGMVKTHKEMGKTSQAQTTAELYINEVYNSAEKLLELGRAFEKRKLDNYTLQCYKRAMRLDPESPEVFKRLGFFYLKKANKALAEEYLRKSFNLDPYQSDVNYQLGQLDVEIGMGEKTE